MTYSYYPGCTLKTKGKDLDRYGRFAAEKLGVTLEEIADWQCCGGAYTMARDEIASKLSAVRALASARDAGNDVVTLCSACHNVLKQVNNDMKTDENINFKANNYLKLETPYNGEANVIHYLELLRDKIGFDKVAQAVTKPFPPQQFLRLRILHQCEAEPLLAEVLDRGSDQINLLVDYQKPVVRL